MGQAVEYRCNSAQNFRKYCSFATELKNLADTKLRAFAVSSNVVNVRLAKKEEKEKIFNAMREGTTKKVWLVQWSTVLV